MEGECLLLVLICLSLEKKALLRFVTYSSNHCLQKIKQGNGVHGFL